MADDLKGIPFSSDDEGKTFPELAKSIVYDQALNLGVAKENPWFSRDDVYVVWFAYVLGYWKAICSTSIRDGRYYEVTFNKEKSVAYVDTYKKTHNIEVTITEEEA
jgi:hypothetical protein